MGAAVSDREGLLINRPSTVKIMPTFKRPPKLIIEIDPYAALVVAECLRLASSKAPAPTLGGMLDYAACALWEAVHGRVPRIWGEHLAEQSAAHLQEMLRGVDRIWEDTMQDMEAGTVERPPDDDWDPEHGEDWKGGPP
jgi:hypothetical protein